MARCSSIIFLFFSRIFLVLAPFDECNEHLFTKFILAENLTSCHAACNKICQDDNYLILPNEKPVKYFTKDGTSLFVCWETCRFNANYRYNFVENSRGISSLNAGLPLRSPVKWIRWSGPSFRQIAGNTCLCGIQIESRVFQLCNPYIPLPHFETEEECREHCIGKKIYKNIRDDAGTMLQWCHNANDTRCLYSDRLSGWCVEKPENFENQLWKCVCGRHRE